MSPRIPSEMRKENGTATIFVHCGRRQSRKRRRDKTKTGPLKEDESKDPWANGYRNIFTLLIQLFPPFSGLMWSNCLVIFIYFHPLLVYEHHLQTNLSGPSRPTMLICFVLQHSFLFTFY
jgi:hypothetical protein